MTSSVNVLDPPELDSEEDFDEPEEELDEESAEFARFLVDRIYTFVEIFTGIELRPYQTDFAKRIIESVITGDGEELTGLLSRQSGKTELVADVVAGLMVILPVLAKVYPQRLGKFKRGVWVGCFAPVEEQANTLFGRILTRLTCDHALDIMRDPEIDDAPARGTQGGRRLLLKRSGSTVRMQTANPKAKIEGTTYHIIIIDEAQGADEYVVRKSISPMGAATNSTIIKIGTPDVVKGDFWRTIQYNKRRDANRRTRKNHFQYDWKVAAKYNPDYKKAVEKEKRRIGEDSDEFRLSYNVEWLLDRGMFVNEGLMESLGDKTMPLVHSWWKSPIVVGIDVARKIDSTVVTPCLVEWDEQDEFGYYPHRILNWLEIHGDNWESQYFQVVDFLSNYKIQAIAVDGQGIGDAFADRLRVLMPGVEVFSPGSMQKDQSERWKHLLELIQRQMVTYPAHSWAKRTARWKRFYQQMIDLEKQYKGPYLLAAAPDEAEAHDDFPQSLALATSLTHDLVLPTIEVSSAPWYDEKKSRGMQRNSGHHLTGGGSRR